MAQQHQELKHLIRLADADMRGTKILLQGLTAIKGVSYALSHAICYVTGIPETKKVGSLTQEDLAKISTVLADPVKAGIPSWMVNRQKDPATGENLHHVSTRIIITLDSDLKELKRIKCYRGIRHMFGLPTRGQRTRSNFRPSKRKKKGGLGVKVKAGTKSRGRS